MNKELILMLVVSFVVGYIVSDVVRKCGCGIVEGAIGGGYGGDGLDDPMQHKNKQNKYTDPRCMPKHNIPVETCTVPGGWIEYIPPSGHKEGACKWVCPGSDLGVCETDSENPKDPAKCNYKPQPN